MFTQVAPTSSKQHGVNVGVNASATAFQQASGYGSHGYTTGKILTRTLIRVFHPRDLNPGTDRTSGLEPL